MTISSSPRGRRLLVATLLALIGALLSSVPAEATNAVALPPLDLANDIDLSGLPTGTTSADQVAGPGYNLMGTAGLLPNGYTLRLLASPNVDDYRDELMHATQQLATLGIVVNIASGTVAEREPNDGETTFEIDDSEGCDGAGIGCAGPLYGHGPDASKTYVRAGRIWIRSGLSGYPADHRRKVVAHELGHALNLAHFDDVYDGTYQVMKQGWNNVFEYRTGDRNGLAWGRDYGAYTPPPPPPPPPPPDLRRVGVLDATTTCKVVEGELTTSFRNVYGPGCLQLALDGNRVGIVSVDGNCYAREGSLTAPLVWLRGPGCLQIAMDGNRIGIVELDSGGNKTCYAKEGSLSAPWVVMRGCTQIALEGTRIGVVSDGNCYVKEGSLFDFWVWQSLCSEIAVDGNRIGVVNPDGQCYVKEGSLFDYWAPMRGCTHVAVDGNRIGVVDPDGTCYAKEGSLYDYWAPMFGPDCSQIALDGNRIATKVPGACYVKEGSLFDFWVYMQGPECLHITLSDGVT